MIITPGNTLISQYQFATTPPDKYKHPGIIGGFGAGKTRSIPLRWINLIEWRARNQKIKTKLMIVEPTKEMIRDILLETFDEFFDAHGITHSYHKTAHNYTIKYKNHLFTALFRSSDNPDSLTGKTLTDVIIDEFDKERSIKKQKDIWKECIARTRKAAHGTVGVVTTPEGFKYTYELYGECDYREKKDFKLIRARTPDNKFLPLDYVQNLYAQYSKELVSQYIEAQFVNITQGKVYYSFDRQRHTKPLKLNFSLPLYLTFDFNINPMTTSFCQIRPGESNEQAEVIEIIHVINNRQSNTDKQCKAIKKWLQDVDYFNRVYGGKLIITGDATNAGSTTSNLTNWQIIREHFPDADYSLLRNSNPAVTDRVNSVNSKFLNSNDKNGIYINNTGCDPLIIDLEQVIWMEGKSEIDKSNKERTHNTDNLGYLVWAKYPLTGHTKMTFGKYI